MDFLLEELLPADDHRNDTEDHENLRNRLVTDIPFTGITLPFVREEVLYAIYDFKKHKAPGPDNIPAEVLQELSTELTPYLCNLYNECLIQGKFPNCWKESNIIVIKKGANRDPLSPKTYRPICFAKHTWKSV